MTDDKETLPDKSITPEQICLCHNRKWSSKYQFLLNQMKGRILPPAFVKKMSMICICKEKNAKYFQGYRHTKLDSIVKGLKDDMESNLSLWNPDTNKATAIQVSVPETFRKLINEKGEQIQESRWRFLLLIYHCIKKDYAIFEKRCLPKPDKIWKDKYEGDEYVEMKFNGGYAPFIFGSQGKYIKQICCNNNCEIRIQDPQQTRRTWFSRGRGRGRGGRAVASRGLREWLPRSEKVFHILIRSNDEDAREAAQDELANHICNVTKSREKHARNVADFHLKREIHLKRLEKNREAKREYNAAARPNFQNVKFRKEIMAEDFSRRRYRTNKEKEARLKRKMETSQGMNNRYIALLGGHCKNCQAPFKDPNSMHQTKCRYHPGYLVNADVDSGHFKTEPVSNPMENTCSGSDEAEERLQNATEENSVKGAHYKNHKHRHKPQNGANNGKSAKSPERKNNKISDAALVVTDAKNVPEQNEDNEWDPKKKYYYDEDNIWYEWDGTYCCDDWGNVRPSCFESQSESSMTSEEDEENTNSCPSKSSDSESDRSFDDELISKSLKDKKVIQKWSCCDLILFEVPDGVRMEQLHYNCLHGGCALGQHYFVPAKSKRERKEKRGYRKSRAPSSKQEYLLN